MGFGVGRWKFRRPVVLIALLISIIWIIALYFTTAKISIPQVLLSAGVIIFIIIMLIRNKAQIEEQMPTEPDRYVNPYIPPQPGDPRFVKTFDYYCPGCLHQTNDGPGRCGECSKEMLVETVEPIPREAKLSQAISSVEERRTASPLHSPTHILIV